LQQIKHFLQVISDQKLLLKETNAHSQFIQHMKVHLFGYLSFSRFMFSFMSTATVPGAR